MPKGQPRPPALKKIDELTEEIQKQARLLQKGGLDQTERARVWKEAYEAGKTDARREILKMLEPVAPKSGFYPKGTTSVHAAPEKKPGPVRNKLSKPMKEKIAKKAAEKK